MSILKNKKPSQPKPKKEQSALIGKDEKPKKDYSEKIESDYKEHPKFSKLKGEK